MDNWSHQQLPISQVPFRSATSAGIVADKEEVKLGEEESPFSGSFFDFIMQCCSGRNRTQDAQRKIASEIGRPPPPPPINNPDRTFTRTQSSQSEFQEALRQRDSQSDTESDHESLCPSKGSRKQEMPPYSDSGSDESLPSYAIRPPVSVPFKSLNSFNREEEYERSPPREEGHRRSPPRVHDDWEWPAWSLNHRQPCIEVFVEDDDTGESKWVAGEPQNRVVNEAGKDTFLCVEYEWHGEFYTQDFEPHQVRRQGDNQTVIDLCGMATPQCARKTYDTGGGVSVLLDDST